MEKHVLPYNKKNKKNLLLDTVEPDDTFQIWSGLAGVHSEKAIDWQDLWNIQHYTIYISLLYTFLTSFNQMQRCKTSEAWDSLPFAGRLPPPTE